MMPAAAARTESLSQRSRKRVAAFIRKISVRRQHQSRARFRGRQYAPSAGVNGVIVPAQPAGQEPDQTEELGNVTSDLPPSGGTSKRSKRDASTGIHAVDQVKTESDKGDTLPVDVDKGVLVTPPSRDTAGGAEQHIDGDWRVVQKECEGPIMSKHYSSQDQVGVNHGEEEHNHPRLRNKLQRTMNSIRATIRRSKGRGSRTGEPIQMDSATATQKPISNSIGTEPLRVDNTQDEAKAFLAAASAPSTESDQLKMANVRDAERTAQESEEIEKLRRDLFESHHQIAELQRRCEAQSRDLENSNNFLNTADKSSDSDVIRALQRLNAEVQQNTTYMVDFLAEDLEFSDVRRNLTKEQSLAVQRASDHIGQVLVTSFGMRTSEDIPMLLQIAFQAYLASVLCQTASSWAFEPAYNAFIDGIYQRLHRVEAQAISGRWRSLARVHIVHNWATHPESLVKGVIVGLSDILLAAGCTATQSDIISKVTSEFEGKITLLVELAGRLNKMFNEVISSDFEVFTVRPAEKFESKKMEDPDCDQVGVQEGPVLCATHLGLTKRVPMGTLWEKGRKQKVVVLKAKVLLESFLNTEN